MSISASSGNFYEYPNGVLRNKYGIQDANALNLAEAAAVSFRLAQMHLSPITGQFYLDHLQAIHRFLFQDVYDWAGELRQVDISKGSSRFAHFGYIAINAQKLFTQLAKEHQLQGLPRDQFARRAAYYLGEINVLHPFREGNGRTQRVFLSDLTRRSGYTLDWALVTPQAMIAASIDSLIRGNNGRFEQIFLLILLPLHP